MELEKSYISTVFKDFQQVTKKPGNFSKADDLFLQTVKSNLKKTYDFSKTQEKKIKNSTTLSALIIKNVDLEQIWQQIELQNDSFLPQSIANVSNLIAGRNQLIFDNLKRELDNDLDEKEDYNDDLENGMEKEENSGSESENDDFHLNEESEKDEDDESDQEETAKLPNTSLRKSVVDDEFFKLEEMEKFLNKEEKKIDNEDQESEESNDESADVDLFTADSEEDDEDEKIKTAKFKDFFVAKDKNKETRRNKFLQEMSDDDLSNDHNAMKSSLELRQERLKKKIEEIEHNAVGEKPWQLKGEIRAEDRPQNSLLQEIVDFDLTSKPAPVITEQTSLQLEDIIKQRIKDKVFDSVERKVKPVETPLEYKKKLVLDQEKSKHSLAQIYEKEYLDQQAALDPENAEQEQEEPELHKEIKNLMRNLFTKLDALSNFHFTPKPVAPELKIVNNLPAISMEEVAPNATSDAALLAPEEVRNKTKGEIIAKTERTATDKKRERRKKKLKQRAHLKEKQKRENGINKLNSAVAKKYVNHKSKKVLQKNDKRK